MHAIVGRWKMDRSRTAEQRDGLQRMVIPQVSQAPGFVRGAWTQDVSSDLNHSFVVFDTEETARAFVASVRAQADRQASVGIELVDMTVAEVIAETGAGAKEPR